MIETYTAEQAHAAVARGAAWLDSKCPTWVSEIDLETLDLSQQSCCVLGQTAFCIAPGLSSDDLLRKGLKGRYRAVLDSLGVDWLGKWPVARGFDIPDLRLYDDEVAAYEMLTIAWSELIRQRREAAQ